MTAALPTTIPAYLAQLRRSLAGADEALIQDALYDAEEYLRSELAAQPQRTEAEVIAVVASSYGAPDEVADIYRDTETTVQTALRLPPPKQPRSLPGRLFGVFVDPHAYGALFYMLLSLVTGTFYFTWVVTGFSLSLGLAITLIGIPLFVLFIASVRVLALLEGRIVETMLGERMPRRPQYAMRGQPLLQRIMDALADPRTWSTLVYFILMLPLGVLYGSMAASCAVLSFAFLVSPVLVAFGQEGVIHFGFADFIYNEQGWVLAPVMFVAGGVLLMLTLHGARLIGQLHAQLAKSLLVPA